MTLDEAVTFALEPAFDGPPIELGGFDGNPVARDRRITGRPPTVPRRSHVRSTHRPGRERARARIRLRRGRLREEATAAAAAGDTGPTAPTNLRLTVNGPYSITLAWDASKTSSSNWWYCIQRDGQGCIRVDPPQTTFTFSKLWPGTTFNYSVIAITSTGKRSATSNTVTYTTPADTTAPSAPTLSLTGTWPVRISVAWTASVDDVGSQVWYTLLVNGSLVRRRPDRLPLGPGPRPLAGDDVRRSR